MSKKFCPNCGSEWVEPDTSNRAEVAYSGGNPNKWKCNDCGYTGLMPEGNNEDIDSNENLEFKPDEEYPREYTGFGKAYLKYLLYIVLPSLVLYTLYLIFYN